MVTARSTLEDGPAGVEETLRALTALKEFYGSRWDVRAAALTIAGGTADNDIAGLIEALASFVRRAVVYVADPLHSEFITTPDVMLLAIDDTGMTHGDCDDHCLLFASLCESVGIPCDIAGVTIDGSPLPNHVICLAQTDAGTRQVDLCAKHGPIPDYPDPLVISS